MNLSVFPISGNVDGVKSTLLNMKEMVFKTDKDRIVKETASSLIKKIPPSNLLMQVKIITGWVRRNLHYVRDIAGVEELTNPTTILYNIREGRQTHSADCDDYAILISALLRSIGFVTRLEAVAVNENRYNHARVSVLIGELWFPIEGTRNTEVGFALPTNLPILYVEVV